MRFGNWTSRLALLIGIALLSSQNSAEAIYGGSSALGNPIVVGLLGDKNGRTSGCSGALVAPRVVMTAAHCLTLPPQNLWIPEPGTDLRDLSTTRIQAEKYFIPSSFSASKFPYQNDFGIVILKSPFANIQSLEIATLSEVQEWMSIEREVTHIGYGCTELVDTPPCRVTSPTPNKFVTQLSKEVPIQFNSLMSGTFSVTKISVEKTICGGDSGSPLITDVSGKNVYIGAQSSSNGAGCTKTCNINCAASQGLPSANIELVNQAFQYVSASQRTMTKTISCTKGKLLKKVTGINPKCPKGYTKK